MVSKDDHTHTRLRFIREMKRTPREIEAFRKYRELSNGRLLIASTLQHGPPVREAVQDTTLPSLPR